MKKAQLQNENVAWSELAVFICSKCRVLFAPENLVSENPAEDLKGFLKARLKEEGLSSKCRVMTSSCQSLCENDKQAVTLCKTQGPTQTLSIHPEKNKEEIYTYILEQLSSK